MNELLKVEINANNEQVISGRLLHQFLEIGTEYTKWFERMCEYGFTENVDFNSVKFDEVRKEGNRTVKRHLVNHILKLNMAKELCMLYEFLQIKTPYTMWINRMISYGFIENIDYVTDNKNVSRTDGAIMPQKEISQEKRKNLICTLCLILGVTMMIG